MIMPTGNSIYKFNVECRTGNVELRSLFLIFCLAVHILMTKIGNFSIHPGHNSWIPAFAGMTGR